jgi:hypothetical protein
MLHEAIEDLGGSGTNGGVRDWILSRYPGTNPNTIQTQIIFCTVNHPSRVNGPEIRGPRIANDPRYDFLFRTAPGSGGLELYNPEVHGVWELRESETGKLVIALANEPSGEPETFASVDKFATGDFGAEAHLQAYLVKNLQVIEPGLELFADDLGRSGDQYSTPAGRPDILAVDAQGRMVVIELKIGRSPDTVIAQALRYRGWVKQHLAGNRDVRTMIVAQEITDRLRYALVDIPSVELKEYELSVVVRDVTTE